jgi:uridine kinase
MTPNDAVLIVDSVFAFRPQYAPFGDYRIWLEIDPDLALRPGVTRDSAREGLDEAVRSHRDRYAVAEKIYLSEVDPHSLVDIILDNADIDTLRVVARRHPAPRHHKGV